MEHAFVIMIGEGYIFFEEQQVKSEGKQHVSTYMHRHRLCIYICTLYVEINEDRGSEANIRGSAGICMRALTASPPGAKSHLLASPLHVAYHFPWYAHARAALGAST